MTDRAQLEALFAKHGFTDYKWIDPHQIVVAQWVRMKCTFGCDDYGQNASCPPNTPSVADCRRFFDEYTQAAIFHFEKRVDKPEDRHPWSKAINQELLKLERAVFLAGNQKAFLLLVTNCSLCSNCAGDRQECKHPESARPTGEGMAIDVFSTVRQVGYPIQVLSGYEQAMNRYAFLLIE